MHGVAAEALAVALLAASLVFAIARPLGLAEAVVAVPCAVLVVGTGIVPVSAAWSRLREIGPTVGFLAAILVFGHLCAEAGVFTYLGALASRTGGGSTRAAFAGVLVVAALVTATLTLDATVVLLTPVVIATAHRLEVPPRPFAYACARIANSGSLLLPVSNLTNLLAFAASTLSFTRFAALMALPWLVACGFEWLALRTFFRRDLSAPAARSRTTPAPPRYALVVLALTVGLFVLASAVSVSPAWAALLGCALLLAPRRRAGDITVGRLIAEASPGFCAFVLALAVIVDGVTRHGLSSGLHHLVPSGSSFAALIGVAVIAAGLANLVNNLPATLALVPVVAGSPGVVLAALIGVNVGPNLSYPGSLATLLWRRQLPEEHKPAAREFHLLGALTVPLLLVMCVGALWISLHLL